MINPKEHKSNYRQVAKELSEYLGEPYDDAFYQRMYRIMRGEVNPPQAEKKAIEAWLNNQANPHKAGAYAYRMQDVPFDVMQRYLLSGIFNTTRVKAMFKKINEIRTILR